jgi:hypothetical protein
MGPTGAATAMPADIDLSSSHGSIMWAYHTRSPWLVLVAKPVC